MAAKLDENGDPIDPNDQYPLDPETSRNTLTAGVKSPETPQPLTDPATTAAPPAPTAASTMPTGIDPALAAIYSGSGLNPADRGSGFADWQYWQDKGPSQYDRLRADIAGTGTDQPTGTPGTGTWSNSGRNAVAPAPLASPTAIMPAAPAVPSTVGPDTGTRDYNDQIRQILLSQIAGLSAPTTAESPDVAPAISAFNTQSQRDQQRDREALAERFYAAGDSGGALDSGGFNTSVQQGLEKAAGDRANFTGSTIYNAAQAKRQQLQQMLQTATNAGLTDAAQQIQAKIAAIDANLRQQGITNQASQFGQSLAQQGSQFDRSLAQQNSQFGDSLGMTYAQMLAQQNRDTLLAGLNG